MEYFLKSTQELPDLAKALIRFAEGRKKILLYGEIGAGKTTFVKAICQELDVAESVNSPTFSLINEYLSDQDQPVYHIDLYRLKDLSEALDIGIEDYLDNPCYCFIEWPEIIETLLPDEVVRVHFELQDDGSRRVLFS